MKREIILLGKSLKDYPETGYYEKRLINTTYSYFRDHNIAGFKSRLKKDFDYEVINNFVKDGNIFWTTNEIIGAVRVSLSLNLLTDEEWKRASRLLSMALKPTKLMSVCLTRCRMYLRSIVKSGRIWICALHS